MIKSPGDVPGFLSKEDIVENDERDRHADQPHKGAFHG